MKSKKMALIAVSVFTIVLILVVGIAFIALAGKTSIRYVETISLDEFVDRTSFLAFENMPWFYHFAFAFGIFEKNTVFVPTRVRKVGDNRQGLL